MMINRTPSYSKIELNSSHDTLHYHHHHRHRHYPSLVKFDRPASASSNTLFRDLPSRLRPFGLLFSIILSSCRCSFWFNVVANLICIFLVSRLMVLLSALPKFLCSFCVHDINGSAAHDILEKGPRCPDFGIHKSCLGYI